MSSTRLHILLLAILVLLLPACSGGEKNHTERIADLLKEDRTPSDYWFDFDTVAEEVRSMMEEASGVDLTDLNYRIADRAALAEAFLNNVGLQELALGEAMEMVTAAADDVAFALLGIYDLTKGEILIGQDTFPFMAALLNENAVDTKEVMTAVMIHETAHAIADRKWPLSIKLKELPDSNALMGFSAVLEGHAQYLTRLHSPRLGVSEAFETYTWAVGALPDDIQGAERLVMEAAVANASFQYYEGETFAQALVKAEGEEIFARLFQEPPSGPAIVTHPSWYLDPSLVEKSSLNLKAMAIVFQTVFDEEGLTPSDVKLNEPTLRAALAPLEKDDVDTVIGLVMDNHIAVLAGENSAMHVAALYDCRTPAGSREMEVMALKLLKARDEAFKDGPIKITRADYSDYSHAGWSGTLASKTSKVQGQEIEATTMILHRGALSIEYSAMNLDFDEATFNEFLEGVNGILAAAPEVSDD